MNTHAQVVELTGHRAVETPTAFAATLGAVSDGGWRAVVASANHPLVTYENRAHRETQTSRASLDRFSEGAVVETAVIEISGVRVVEALDGLLEGGELSVRLHLRSCWYLIVTHS
jgi:hypothetical protein